MTVDSGISRAPLPELGAHLVNLRLAGRSAETRRTVDAAIRCSLLSIGVGAIEERQAAPLDVDRFCPSPKGRDDLFGAMGLAVFAGTLGAAADLDPLDIGPAHLALPSTVATCIVAELLGRSDSEIGDAILAGMEAAARARGCILGVRPGTGFHSAGTFGLLSAGVAVARLLGAGPTQIAHSIGIALTRAGGLALNNASTRIGLTHFGWAAAHGIEAGWLAAEGATASLDLEAAFSTLFGDRPLDLAHLTDPEEEAVGGGAVVFKHYPCNIYLNLVVKALLGRPRGGAVEVRMPSIPHLDQPRPADLRAARNSAQAVAAVASLYDPRYSSFVAPLFDPERNPELRSAMDGVRVLQDPAWPTDLRSARIEVDYSLQGGIATHSEHRMSELAPWGREHALTLAGDIGPPGWIDRVYDDGYLGAYRQVRHLLNAEREDAPCARVLR